MCESTVNLSAKLTLNREQVVKFLSNKLDWILNKSAVLCNRLFAPATCFFFFVTLRSAVGEERPNCG